jgi:hypothetical protein
MIEWIKNLFREPESPMVLMVQTEAKARLDAGLKGFPGCPGCQCYPEGRNDCADHMKCREWLAENERRYRSNAAVGSQAK